MSGKKQAEGKAANTTEKAANPSNTEATQQQPTPQVADEAKNESEAKSPVTDPPVTTEEQATQPSSPEQQGDTKGNNQEDDKSVSVAKSEEKDVVTEKMTSELKDEPMPKVTEDAKDKVLWADDSGYQSEQLADGEAGQPPSSDQQGDVQEVKANDDNKLSLIKDKEAEANTKTTTQTQDKNNPPVVEDEIKPKPPEKNPFELRIKNNGRRRLLQFCGVFLESGQTTTVTLKNQLEVDHVKDTLRQFNELAGRNDLVVEEAE